ncbi:potassium-transporting ATPase subunit KdpB [Frankia sp. AgPm24]|uniref:potassium-transporting ATPase subunit KdpB n=1 Tax=Frankia sp. AgPm24 TaxID=631128 RepID=UPI0035B1EB25
MSTTLTVAGHEGAAGHEGPSGPRRVGGGVLDPRQLARGLPDALRKLDPRTLWHNPVMFIVEVGAAYTTVLAVADPSVFGWLITGWLWLTVVFANLAEAVAEGRGKAQAAALRRTRGDTVAHRLTASDWSPGDPPETVTTADVPAPQLARGDLVVVVAGENVPGDGDVVEGIASVDESAITGESAPVIRESGGDRSSVTGGTRVLSDRIVVRITQQPGESFIDRMIALVEGADRRRTPNEIALNILLAALTVIFLLAVATLQPLAAYTRNLQPALPDSATLTGHGITGIVLVSLVVCLIPTTIGALLSAIGIAGMDRLVQRNVLAMSGRAVEAAGDVGTLLLDKTGTITFGNRQARAFLPVGGIDPLMLADAAQLSSLADETPEGRSVVVFAKEHHGLRERAPGELRTATFVPFTAQTRMSGVDLTEITSPVPPDSSTSPDGLTGSDGPAGSEGAGRRRQIRKGAASAVVAWVRAAGGAVPDELAEIVDRVSAAGGTPLVVAEITTSDALPNAPTAASPSSSGPSSSGPSSVGQGRVLGVIQLSDVVKTGMRERFDEMRRMGIRTVMITGDNPLTAKAIAEEAGVDDFLAEATPEDKLALIRAEQANGTLVAMTGDGTNDAPALAQADVGVAMNTGTSAAKEAGNMVDLDSDPTKLIEIVEIGKQLLITRGALTTFSIANDVAKYFAIIPALFAGVYGGLDRLNVMRLATPESAILSAVIFNALVIVALIPLALRGVRYVPSSASALLSRNLTRYGLGGIVAPFVGIKLIDLLIQFVPGVG